MSWLFLLTEVRYERLRSQERYVCSCKFTTTGGTKKMKDGLHVIDSDLHVIETGDIYEKYLDEKYRDKKPKYLGLSPTNFPHWEVQGQMIPPWAVSADVVKAQKFLDKPTEHMYKSVRKRGYDSASTLKAMDAEGIDIGVVYRTFAHMV